MVCAEKERLRGEYATATASLRLAWRNLYGKTGEALAQALVDSKAARAECEKARRALAEHKAQHRC
jgi:hypothetical protein